MKMTFTKFQKLKLIHLDNQKWIMCEEIKNLGWSWVTSLIFLILKKINCFGSLIYPFSECNLIDSFKSLLCQYTVRKVTLFRNKFKIQNDIHKIQWWSNELRWNGIEGEKICMFILHLLCLPLWNANKICWTVTERKRTIDLA